MFAQPKSLARSLQFSFACFLAQVVQVDLCQCPEDGQHQLAPGRGEIELLLDGGERDSVTVQLIQGGQQTAQVSIEAVDLVHDNYVEIASLSILHQMLEGRPAAAMAFDIAGDIALLRIQAEPFHLVLHGHPAVTDRAQGW
jgi:hypothetical protein